MRSPRRYDYIARRILMRKALKTDNEEQALCDMYTKEFLSASEIVDRLSRCGIQITERVIQRIVQRHGVSRTTGDAYRLAAKKGRINWAYKDPALKVNRKSLNKKLRFSILKRDGFKCILCGATAQSAVLEVDHITPLAHGGTDVETNLRTLCYHCNMGKRLLEKER